MTATFRLKSATTEPLTPELVQSFMSLAASPTERPFSQKRADHLRDKIVAGNAVTFHWAKAEHGGQEIRMNGQHSTKVLSELNGNFPQGLFAHLDSYEVDDEQGLVLLFRQFDDRVSNRTPGDVAGAYQMLEPALREIKREIAKLGVEGISWYDWHIVGVRSKSGDERYTLFHDVGTHPFLKWIGGIFSLKTRELENQAIVAAMWATFCKNAGAAQMFWDLVSRGGMQGDDDHPATKADEWFKAAKEKRLSFRPKPGEFFNACIFAWNAYRREDRPRSIKHDTSKGMLEPME